jgi:hypothetical protein
VSVRTSPGYGGGIGGGILRVGGGVSAPRPIYDPDPQCSVEARRAKYQGTVLLWVVGRWPILVAFFATRVGLVHFPVPPVPSVAKSRPSPDVFCRGGIPRPSLLEVLAQSLGHLYLYLSDLAFFFPSVMALLNSRLIRVW